MKKIIIVMISALMIFGLIGCGEESMDKAEGEPTSVNTDSVVASEDGDTGMPQNGQDAHEQVGRPGGPDESRLQMIDMATAAEQLGVTEEALMDAMGDSEQGPSDFAAAAETLGITEADLLDALGIDSEDGEPAIPENKENRPAQGGPGGQNESGQQMIDMAAVAEQLGLTEEALIDAMGNPEQGAPDFAAAAETLGITEADLLDAMGINQ